MGSRYKERMLDRTRKMVRIKEMFEFSIFISILLIFLLSQLDLISIAYYVSNSNIK